MIFPEIAYIYSQLIGEIYASSSTRSVVFETTCQKNNVSKVKKYESQATYLADDKGIAFLIVPKWPLSEEVIFLLSGLVREYLARRKRTSGIETTIRHIQSYVEY